MKRWLRYAGAMVLVLLATGPLRPQSTGGHPDDAVIRVTVDLVQLDAVVTDSHGHHVADLKPDDFQVSEDGKPQRITHFSYVSGTAPTIANPPPRASPEETLAPVPSATKALRPEQVRRTIVLMADDLGLSADDIPNVRKAMKDFVEREMQPGDLVSVMTTSGGMGAMQQLTNDRRQLLASIDRIHYVLGRTGQTWYEPTNIGGKVEKFQTESSARINAVRAPALVPDTLGAVAYAIQGLHEMPGRKAIALFSGGFSQSAEGTVQLANRASVVLYTIDPRGLASFFLTAVDKCFPCADKAAPQKITGGERDREAFYRASQRSLDQMARGTGGLFFHDNNDLGQGLANALDDMGSYYLIGYQPQRADFDQVRGSPQFHKIEVKALRTGLQVRSRNGFLGTADPPPVPEEIARKPGSEELRRALLSPFRAGDFPVRLSLFYSASNRRDPKTGRRLALLRAMLAIDARGLTFSDAPNGKKELNLEIVSAAYGASPGVVAKSDRTFRTAMTADEMKETLASGLVYGFEIEIQKPGPYQLRVAALDANADRLGSASAFVEIPDFNRAALALSSVQLYDSDLKRNAELTRAGVLGAGSPVTRAFASGAVLKYDCTVYGPLIDRQPGGLDVAVNLFRGAEQVYTGPSSPLAIESRKTADAVPATGEIQLPATLPPGDYALELIVHDRLQKKQSPAVVQWVDFTLFQ